MTWPVSSRRLSDGRSRWVIVGLVAEMALSTFSFPGNFNLSGLFF